MEEKGSISHSIIINTSQVKVQVIDTFLELFYNPSLKYYWLADSLMILVM